MFCDAPHCQLLATKNGTTYTVACRYFHNLEMNWMEERSFEF